MQSKKKGFTLIELLAVIVILAIIALIAVPVIMNVIENARKSAFEDSVYGVIEAAELYYSNQLLKPDGMTEDKEFVIQDGKFVGENKLEVSGSLPKSGKVKITKEGKLALALTNGDYYVQKATTEEKIEARSLKEDNIKEEIDYKMVFTISEKNSSIPTCITNNTTCEAGTGVAIKVNDTETYDFYVMSEDASKGTITLIMNVNLGETVAWISKDDYVNAGGTEADYGSMGNNNKGPITALKELEERTTSWTNIPLQTYTLTDDNNQSTPQYTPITRTARARLITFREAKGFGCKLYKNDTCPKWLYENGESYWTSTTVAGYVYGSWYVDNKGKLSDNRVKIDYHIRPVITISKTIL